MLLSFVLSFISLFLILNLVHANQIEIEGLKSMSREEFLYLIDLKEHCQLEEQKITEGIKRVFLKDIFEDIVVERVGERIKVYVREKPIVKSIDLSGNKIFDFNFFKKLITVKEKDRLKERELKRSAEKIQDELKRKGFPNSRVDYIRECKEEMCSIVFVIHEGTPVLVNQILWTGDRDETLMQILDIQEGEPLDQSKIEEFIERAKNYYKKRGLIGSEIKYAFKDGILKINFKRGFYLEIDFLGVEELNIKNLEEIAKSHFEDKLDEDILRDSINSLISFYRTNGFTDVRVYSITERIDDTIKITYVINEGKKKVVEDVIFVFSEHRVDTKDLLGLLSNRVNVPYKPDEIEMDKRLIIEYLKSKGFYFANIESLNIVEKEDKVRLTYKISEGKVLRITNIDLKVSGGYLSDSVQELLKNWKDSIFNQAVFLEIRRKVAEAYSSEGYSDVRVDGVYRIENGGVSIFLKVEPGERRFFGKSVILGNRRTKTSFIYDRLLQKDGKPFNLSVTEQERQNLYRTGLFSKVDITTQKKGETIDVIYNLEEAPAGAIEFGLGYGEYEKAKGFIEFSYINLFGMNKQVFSRIEVSNIEKRSYLTYVDPWFLEDITLKTSLNFERFDYKNIDTKDILYRLQRVGITVGFEKKLFENFKVELAYEVADAKTWDVKPDIVISEHDEGKFFISGFRASMIYDSRDNPFDPRKGWLGGFSTKLSSKFIGSELNFLKTSFYLNKYTELFEGFLIAKSIRAGWTWTYGETDILPIQERYFLGGRDTVRGYAQNMLGPKRNNQPTGGQAFLMGNLELRSSLGKNFYLVNFIDFGNVWSRVGKIKFNDLKYTAGLGLRYKTPVGPLRIDYGYKLNRERDESHGEIHFSIGHAF